MAFAIERTTVFDTPVLAPVGELDVASAPLLARAAADELILEPASLVIDLTPTTFLDSSGARTLAQFARRAAAQGVALQVVCPRTNNPVRMVIDLLELRRVMTVIETVPRRPIGLVGGEDAPSGPGDEAERVLPSTGRSRERRPWSPPTRSPTAPTSRSASPVRSSRTARCSP